MSPMHPIGLDLREHERDGERSLMLVGELDIASVPILHGAVERLHASTTCAVTIDLSELQFIDSTGLAAIVFAGKLCEQRGYRFSLIAGPPSVQRLFELTGLIEVLPFVGRDALAGDSAAECHH